MPFDSKRSGIAADLPHPIRRATGLQAEVARRPRNLRAQLFALVIIAASVLMLGACSLNAYPCRGPYGEPCGGPRSGWPGAVTCPSC